MLWATVGSAQIFQWQNPNFTKTQRHQDSVLAQYYNRSFALRDSTLLLPQRVATPIDDGIIVKNDRQKFLGDLQSKGSIIRGITFGNNQGSAVQSTMDLQINGKISPDISIIASVSDHNLPIQADGYTQTLDEFDKIYLQLNIREKHILRAGHLDLQDQYNYISRYQRRTLGLQYETNWGTDGKTNLAVAAGVARSEFHRIRFQGKEGNQGPYRLTGKNGETFVTIISGSEQVFIDGILMKRGENLDYVINYNTGEVTFTSLRPIFSQNFITISYNYTNRNYSRYTATGQIQHQRDRWDAAFGWFIESDNRSAPLSLKLTDEDKKTLAAAGNDAELLYAPSATLTTYEPGKILYRKITDNTAEHFEYSTDPNTDLYQVAFTYFGNGKGDYRVRQTGVNGRIFEYVGPNAGDYRAVKKLVAPVRAQVYSFKGNYRISNGLIGGDFSYSNFDPNLYSSAGNKDNNGYAARIFAARTFKINNWTGTPSAEYQRISSAFYILDRINDVEFSRNFNLPLEFNHRTQDRVMFAMKNLWENKAALNVTSNYLREESYYRGLKNDADFFWNVGSFRLKGFGSMLNTRSEDLKTNFLKGSFSIEKNIQQAVISVGAATEKNDRDLVQLNKKDALSFAWREFFAESKWSDSLRTKLLTRVYYRENDSVRDNSLQHVNKILGVMLESQILQKTNASLSTRLHYRRFLFNDQQLSASPDFLIGNLTYQQNIKQGGLRIQAFYELANGQEPQREFQYLKVQDGKGIYKWTDYNADGQQQLDEFEVAEYADLAQYIRVYTTAVKYVASNKNKFQLSLALFPAQLLDSENKLLRRINLNTSISSQNSFLKNGRLVAFNPFEDNADLFLKNQNILASLQFNQTATSGWNGNYRFLNNQSVLNANFSREERTQKSHIVHLGYSFNDRFRVDWENAFHKIDSQSEQFSTRDYVLENKETKPKLTLKLNDLLQAELNGALRKKQRLDGEESLRNHDIGAALQLDWRKTSLRAAFNFINNEFSGNPFSLVGNQMLDGLRAGKNQVWNVFLQQTITSFLNLNITYEGRHADDRTIHTGSMQLRASF